MMREEPASEEQQRIAIRDQAVANVDHEFGYTIEFAYDPADHAAAYDEEEERLLLEAGLSDSNYIRSAR